MKRHLLLWAAVALMHLPATGAWALSFRFTTDPIKVYGRPGQVFNRSFALTLAKEEKATHFRAHVEDWWRSEDGKQSFYRPTGTVARSCGSWVKLNPVESSVSGGETLTLRVTVAIPDAVKPGGYWCALTVDQLPDPLAGSQGVGVSFLASVSVGIFVYVGPLDQRTRITAIRVLPDRTEVTLRNEGNCPVAAEGRVEFVRPGEKQPAAVSVIPRVTVLPEPVSAALLTSTLPEAKDLPAGRYLVRVILDTGLDHYIGAQKEMEIAREGSAQDAPR